MTTKEEYKNQLRQQGYTHIYEWTDEPGTEYPEHAHKGKVTFYIYEGSLTMNLEDRGDIILKQGDKLDVPIGVNHTAVVGENGCTFVVGEEIEGDS